MSLRPGTTLSALAVLCFSVSFAAQGAGGGAGHPVVSDPPAVDRGFPPGMEGVQIPSGDATMNGQMYVANGPGPHPTVLLLHGFPGDEKSLDLARALQRAGFNILFFHYRGAWGSGGTYSLPGQVEDVKAALVFLRQPEVAEQFRVDPTRLMTVGHSLGGFNALITGVEDPEIICTVAMAPANLGASMARSLEGEPPPGVNVPVNGLAGYTSASLAREIAEGQPRFDVAARMGAMSGRPLLIVSADKDATATPERVAALADAARAAGVSPFDHVVLDGDHSFNWTRVELSRVIVDWTTEHCM
ncbi:MAG: alpha/beta fold hydrolase [Dehalococcoidia bacterium]